MSHTHSKIVTANALWRLDQFHALSDSFRQRKLVQSGLVVTQNLRRLNDVSLSPDFTNKLSSEFYKLCTREFAEGYFVRIKEFISWLTSQITFDE